MIIRKCKLTAVFFCLFFNLIGLNLVAQISDGGHPFSFSLDLDIREVSTLFMPPVNVEELIREDEELSKDKTPRPFRFGYVIDADIDLKRFGTLKQLDNGDKLWLLKIHSENAYSINLIYNHFRLSRGSKLFIYNEDRSMVLGAFTPEVSNNQYNEFATDLVQGNTIILEYYEPEYSNDGVINISQVIHSYINTFSSTFSAGLGRSAECNIDINCQLGSIYERRAISLIVMGNYFCSGCLINNTKQDLTPYFLTARHCFYNINTGQPYTDRSMATSIFRFLYWRPYCGSGNPVNWVSITGSSMRANYVITDFLLLQLLSTPPRSYNLYYGGWDRISIPAQNATGLHHPRGDAMKFCYTSNPVTPVAVTIWNNSTTLSHWRATFTQGIAQHGSSGSPLFNQHHKIVGQLTGNQNDICGPNESANLCHCIQTPIGEYGRFDLSWNGSGFNGERLSNYLDPTPSTNQMALGGLFYCDYTTLTGIQWSKKVDCIEITIQNATVPNGEILELKATNKITINSGVTVQTGGTLILDAGAGVSINSGYTVESGATLIIR